MNLSATQPSLQWAQPWLDAALPSTQDLLLKSSLWSVAGGLLGLVLALVVSLQLKRRRVLHREHRAWNLAAKGWYLLILLSFVLAGVVAGALHGAQGVLNQVVDDSLQPTLARHMPAVRAQLLSKLAPMAGDAVLTVNELVRPLTKDLQYQPTSDSYLEQTKARWINEALVQGSASALSWAFQQALAGLPDLLPANDTGDQSGRDRLIGYSVRTLAQALSGTAQQLDFSPLDRDVPQVFAEALKGQIHGFFKGLYTGLAVKLLLLAGLIAAETMVYLWLHRRRPAVTPAQ